MAITLYNQYLSRTSSNFDSQEHFYADIQTTTVNLGGTVLAIQRAGSMVAMPNPLPTGVTAYIPTMVTGVSSLTTLTFLVGKLINLGSIDISGASGTFTAGNAMPTKTELGVSRQVWSPLIIEVTTGLNATPGTLTVTYKDQDGNAAEAASAVSLGASAPVFSSGIVPLNTGDIGVTQITNATRGAGTTPTGVVQFWGMSDPIALFPANPALNGPAVANLMTSAFHPVRLGAGDQIGVFIIGSNATKSTFGFISFVGE